ncbi:MAG: hypothetical protein U0L85_03970 [Bacilli bacterium]|jgi:hypothetical protein|nr:hypothetical protein [Bacilli bacterium]
MSRYQICLRCGIYDSTRKICNGNLFINPETNDVSTRQKSGYIKGCDCYIPMKVLKDNAKCPAGKW